jgi:hypothetical protein
MSLPVRARLPQAFTPVLRRLVTIALLIGVFGALVVHHSDDASADGATAAITAVAATGPLSDSSTGQTATAISDKLWLVAAGCAALGLCCVLGLAIAKRPAQEGPERVVPLSLAPRSVSPQEPSVVALLARPSLLHLSISRT